MVAKRLLAGGVHGHLVLVPAEGTDLDAGRQLRALDRAREVAVEPQERPDVAVAALLVQRPARRITLGDPYAQDAIDLRTRLTDERGRPRLTEVEQQRAQAAAAMPGVHDLFRDDRGRGRLHPAQPVTGEAAAGVLDDP